MSDRVPGKAAGRGVYERPRVSSESLDSGGNYVSLSAVNQSSRSTLGGVSVGPQDIRPFGMTEDPDHP